MTPPTGLSRRSAILMMLIVAILIMLSPVIRALVAQQEQLDSLRANVASTQQQVDSLNQQLSQWNDNAYVKAQARARFGYVMPGETQYIALGATQAQEAQTDPAAAAARSVANAKGPWFSTLWNSVAAAGQSPG